MSNPVIITPGNGSNYDKGNITVKWNRVTGAENYAITVRDLTENIVILPLKETGGATEYTLSESLLKEGHRFRIAVSTSAPGAVTKWGQVEFGINNTQPETVNQEIVSTHITIKINGEKLDCSQPPILINGTTLVPLRDIFEALGAEVKWEGSTQNVTAVKGNTVITLKIGSNSATASGKIVKLDEPSRIIGESTMVPVRFVSEALGADVNWDGTTSTVLITTKPESPGPKEAETEKPESKNQPPLTPNNEQPVPPKNNQPVINVSIDGKVQTYSQNPVLINGNVFVPMRGIFEELGAEVMWNGSTQTVTAEKGSTTIVLRIGSYDATVDGRIVRLVEPGRIIGGSTMVPVRFVSEALGADVKWEAGTSTVVITTMNKEDLSSKESQLQLLLPKEFGNGKNISGVFDLRTIYKLGKPQHVYYYLIDEDGKDYSIGVSKEINDSWVIKFDTFKYANGKYRLTHVAAFDGKKIFGDTVEITINDEAAKVVLPEEFGKKSGLIVKYLLKASTKPGIKKVTYYLTQKGKYVDEIGNSQNKQDNWAVTFKTNKFNNGQYELQIGGLDEKGQRVYGKPIPITLKNIYTYNGKDSTIGIRKIYNDDAYMLILKERLYVTDSSGKIYKKLLTDEGLTADHSIQTDFKFKPDRVYIRGKLDDSIEGRKLYINSAGGNSYFSQIPEEIEVYSQIIDEQKVIRDVANNAVKSKKIDEKRKNEVYEITQKRIEAYELAKKGIFIETFIKDQSKVYIAKRGDKGNNVKEIQEILKQLGYSNQKTNSVYDAATFKNVAFYQIIFKNALFDLLKMKGPDITGYVDEDTYNILWGEKLYKIDPKERARKIGALVKAAVESGNANVMENFTVELDGQSYRMVKMSREWLRSKSEIKVGYENVQWIFLDSKWLLVNNSATLIRLERIKFANELLNIQRINKMPQGLKELIKLNNKNLESYQNAMTVKEICQGLSVNLVLVTLTGGVGGAAGGAGGAAKGTVSLSKSTVGASKGLAGSAKLVIGNTAKDFAEDRLKDAKLVADIITRTLIEGLERDVVNKLIEFHNQYQRITSEEDAARYIELTRWSYAVVQTIQLQTKLDGRDQLIENGYSVGQYVTEMFQKALFTSLKNEDGKILGQLTRDKEIMSQIVGQLFNSDSDLFKVLDVFFNQVPSINEYLKRLEDNKEWSERVLNPIASDSYTMKLVQQR